MGRTRKRAESKVVSALVDMPVPVKRKERGGAGEGREKRGRTKSGKGKKKIDVPVTPEIESAEDKVKIIHLCRLSLAPISIYISTSV